MKSSRLSSRFSMFRLKKVNTINQFGKMKRQGRFVGRRASTKKAYVQLKESSKGIDFFDSLSQ